MKDDFGRTWKTNDYFMAVFIVIIILICILAPTTAWAGTMYLFDFDKDIVAGSVLGIIVFWFIAMILWELKINRDHKKFLKSIRGLK